MTSLWITRTMYAIKPMKVTQKHFFFKIKKLSTFLSAIDIDLGLYGLFLCNLFRESSDASFIHVLQHEHSGNYL